MDGKSAGDRPTIHDVARLAGVSRGTVSRVLNGARHVSPTAREAVEAAVLGTGYVVNSAARSLVKRQQGQVAFLLTPANGWQAEGGTQRLLWFCSRALAARGRTMLLVDAAPRGGPAALRGRLRDIGVTAALAAADGPDQQFLAQLATDRLTVGVFGARFPGPARSVHWVGTDERAGAGNLVRHLLLHGHRRIGLISGPLGEGRHADRLTGCQETLAAAGLAECPVLVEETDGRAAGRAAMDRMLRHGPGPDAVVATGRGLLTGALDQLAARGLRSPEDVVLGGFDDADASERPATGAVLVHLPWRHLAEALVEAVLAPPTAGSGSTTLIPSVLAAPLPAPRSEPDPAPPYPG